MMCQTARPSIQKLPSCISPKDESHEGQQPSIFEPKYHMVGPKSRQIPEQLVLYQPCLIIFVVKSNPQFQEIQFFDEFRWLDITGPDPGVQEVRALSVCAALGNTLAEHKSAMGCDGRGSHGLYYPHRQGNDPNKREFPRINYSKGFSRVANSTSS